MKLRILWRKGVADENGKLAEYEYKSDVVDVPETANAFKFWGAKEKGWMPEVIGGEWIADNEVDAKNDILKYYGEDYSLEKNENYDKKR